MNNVPDIKPVFHSRLMGIVNVTPDSFSDGGEYWAPEKAVEHALELLDDGAGIIDIGGESTRPGADFVSVEQEIDRVVPVIRGLKNIRPDCVISLDTRKSEVARAGLEAGADIINDISGLAFSPDMAQVVAEYNAGLVIMHMRGTPETMQDPTNLEYKDVVVEVKDALERLADSALVAGVAADRIILDPGIGFSKNLEQNLDLLANIDKIKETGYPVLVGPSRKSFIGGALNITSPTERKWGTAGAVAFLAMKQIDIIRVHDVREMREALQIFELCLSRQRVF